MRISGSTLIAALVIGLTLPSAAVAQDDADTERARALFAEGVELSSNAEYEAASAKFHEAYALVQAPNIAYNLAVALVELGQIVEASEYVQVVLQDEEAPRDVQRLARRLEGTIDAQIGRLTVTLIQSRGSAAILLDGNALLDTEIGVPVPVNPGAHVVTAERDGEVLERQEENVEAGQSKEVLLDPSTWTGASLDPELYDEAPPQEEDSGGGGILSKWWFWTAVAVVVIGGGIAIGVAASSTEGPLEGNTSPAVGRF